MACLSLSFLIALIFLLWGFKVGSSFYVVEDEDDDDNMAVAILNAIPFLFIGSMLLLFCLADLKAFKEILIFLGLDSEAGGNSAILGLFALFLPLLALREFWFTPWRLTRWAEKRGYKLLNFHRTKGNLFVNAITGRSKYQSFYTLNLQDKNGATRTAEVIIGSYWGTNPNKFEVAWK